MSRAWGGPSQRRCGSLHLSQPHQDSFIPRAIPPNMPHHPPPSPTYRQPTPKFTEKKKQLGKNTHELRTANTLLLCKHTRIDAIAGRTPAPLVGSALRPPSLEVACMAPSAGSSAIASLFASHGGDTGLTALRSRRVRRIFSSLLARTAKARSTPALSNSLAFPTFCGTC